MDIRNLRIGIDVGGVIAEKTYDRAEDTGSESLLKAPIKDSLEIISLMIKRFGASNIFIVSFCGKRREVETLIWFDLIKLYDTGLLRENVHFVRSRAAKAPLCEDLNINCFIDDTWEVINNIVANCRTIRRILWYNGRSANYSSIIKPVHNWQEIKVYFEL
jgi:hypothetical protein